MIALVGCSGSGKTKVCKYLENEYGMERLITSTTRAPRAGEVHGVDYYFLTEDEMQLCINRNYFHEKVEYNGHVYGSRVDMKIEDRTIAVLTPYGMDAYKHILGDKLFTVYLDVDETTRAVGMLRRGDGIDKVYSRIIDDRCIYFSLEREVDLTIHNNDFKFSHVKIAEQIFNEYANKVLNKNKENING